MDLVQTLIANAALGLDQANGQTPVATPAAETVDLIDHAGRYSYVLFQTYIKRVDNNTSPATVTKASSTEWPNRAALSYV